MLVSLNRVSQVGDTRLGELTWRTHAYSAVSDANYAYEHEPSSSFARGFLQISWHTDGSNRRAVRPNSEARDSGVGDTMD
jgi:hypothetical protein